MVLTEGLIICDIIIMMMYERTFKHFYRFIKEILNRFINKIYKHITRMVSATIVPMLDVMKIVMTKNWLRRLWWESNLRDYETKLKRELVKLKENEVKNSKQINNINKKIKACRLWLNRFGIDPIRVLGDAQLEVVIDIINDKRLRTKYQREIRRVERRIEQVENAKKENPRMRDAQIYDVKTLKNACQELLKRHIA